MSTKTKLFLQLLGWTVLWFFTAGLAIGSIELFRDRRIIEGTESLIYFVMCGLAIYGCFLIGVVINRVIGELYEAFTKK